MPLNIIGSFQQGQQAREFGRESRARREERERAAETRNRLRDLLSGPSPATPEAREAFTREIGAITGDPGMVMDWRKHFAGQRPDVLAQRTAEAPHIVANLAGVADQASYDAARQRTAELGIDVSDWDEMYDPARVNMVMQAARYLAEGPAEPAGGPFAGTGIEASAMNILLDPNADPSSATYRAAYNRQAQPRTTYNPTTGQLVTITPDMSAFRPPSGGAARVAADAAGEPEKAEPMGPVSAAPGVTIKEVSKPKLTQEEKTAAGFAHRIAASNKILDELEEAAGAVGRYAAPYTPNWAKPEEWQRLEQAQREFINAQLRRESGAVISTEEFANAAQQYFPQPGDSPAVVQQKRKSRELALKNMRQSAGRAETDEPEDEPEDEDLDFRNMSEEELRRLAQ